MNAGRFGEVFDKTRIPHVEAFLTLQCLRQAPTLVTAAEGSVLTENAEGCVVR